MLRLDKKTVHLIALFYYLFIRYMKYLSPSTHSAAAKKEVIEMRISSEIELINMVLMIKVMMPKTITSISPSLYFCSIELVTFCFIEYPRML